MNDIANEFHLTQAVAACRKKRPRNDYRAFLGRCGLLNSKGFFRKIPDGETISFPGKPEQLIKALKKAGISYYVKGTAVFITDYRLRYTENISSFKNTTQAPIEIRAVPEKQPRRNCSVTKNKEQAAVPGGPRIP